MKPYDAGLVTPVTATHEIDAAIKSAMARADKIFTRSQVTIVDSIPLADWANWDASGEVCSVFGIGDDERDGYDLAA
jgi:hypothetical protein